MKEARTGKEEGTRAFIIFVLLLCFPMILAEIGRELKHKLKQAFGPKAK